MDDGVGQEIARELDYIGRMLKKHNDLQEEANGLMRALIPALEATAQELLESRQQLGSTDPSKFKIPLVDKP